MSNFTQNIPGTECIGDSLPKINSNYANLDTAVTTLSAQKVSKSGDIMTGFLTLHANPTDPLHASTREFSIVSALIFG